MQKYQCVIFDCDGVLVDSEPIGNRIMVEMANELGANINLDYALKHFKGNSLQMCFDAISVLANSPIPSGFDKEYRKRSFEAFRKEIKPVDGIVEVLEQIQVTYCVASSGPENKIRLNLELTGLLPYFESQIFSCYTISKWKPDPAIFLWAAKTMGFQPEQCLIVEDSPLGVKGGKAGGFDVFAYTAHDYNEELSAMADYASNSIRDVLLFV